MKKGVLRKFHKIHRKTPVPESLLSLRPATLFKKRLWHRCFPLNFAKFLRAPFLYNTSGQLILKIYVKISSHKLDQKRLQ